MRERELEGKNRRMGDAKKGGPTCYREGVEVKDKLGGYIDGF